MASKKSAKKSSTPSATHIPAKSSKGSTGARGGSKTAFILAHPLDAAARAVVEAGKAAGHVFNDTYVWAVRASAKRKGKGATATAAGGPAGRAEKALAKLTAKRGPGRPRRSPEEEDGDTGPLAVSGSLETQFAALAVELGISRAESILRKVRDVLAKLTF